MDNRYDALFSDIEGTHMYLEFLKKHISGKNILEFACGTSDLLNLLDQDYNVLGLDIDPKMIDTALEKYPKLKGKIKVGNFLDYREENRYDTLICVGDSLNYMDNLDELDQFVETAVSLSDTIIVDFHHPYRLIEFEEGYFEEGSHDTFDYSYMIEVSDDRLVHTINYLNGTYENVLQWVFKPQDIIERFEAKGYTSLIFSDFDQPGIIEEAEKVMCIFKKELT